MPRTLIFLTLALVTTATQTNADQFRMDSMVFRDGEDDAICRTTTFFRQTRIYDVLHPGASEVTIIDTSKGSVVILDRKTETRATISFEDLKSFVAAASQRARESTSVVKFAAQPDFKISFATERRLLQLDGEEMKYRVETESASSDEIAHQFQQFADWKARLNTTRPGLPPAARLVLNQQLFDKKHLPRKISRTIQTVDGPQRLTSRHEYSWNLMDDDIDQLREFDDWARDFKSVELPQMFRRVP